MFTAVHSFLGPRVWSFDFTVHVMHMVILIVTLGLILILTLVLILILILTLILMLILILIPILMPRHILAHLLRAGEAHRCVPQGVGAFASAIPLAFHSITLVS